jgi:small-conductance mechanosensitive channel/CRP-like cAMP-binding protein
MFETILGFSLVWFFTGAVQAVFLSDARSGSVRARTPRLLVDIIRLSFVLIGMVMVVSGVWQRDISPLLTTFGVGSLVLGLALQDTLGNLFSGLALVFERPLATGDWVQLGDTVGKVRQINWRSVRIVTRELNEITVPNLSIGKEKILNFSNPTRLHGLKVTFGFSYDAPPNSVKEMLLATACDTPKVLHDPAPDARTIEFAAYAVTYELRFFIADYEDIVDVRNDLLTRVWYAAQRHGLHIPYPITTLYKTEVPYVAKNGAETERLMEALRSSELFKSLSHSEIATLAAEVSLQRFAKGERLIREGGIGDHFFILIDGQCSVEVRSSDGTLVPVAAISGGSVIGEMSLLAGTPRTANVTAQGDVFAARIGKEALTHLLSRREDLAAVFAHYAAQRTKELDAARLQSATLKRTKSGEVDELALGERIRRFFLMG